MFLEVIIVFGISLFLVLLFSLIITMSDKYTPEGILGIMDQNAKSRHYCLKKTRICFLFIFLINRKWKKGLISKYSFWAVMTIYIYLFVAIIVEIIFMSFDVVLRMDMPLIFVGIWILVPVVFLIITPFTLHAIQKFNQR